MKLFNSSQRVITILLFLLLLVSISFIIHLEIKAANILTKWEEHEKSLLKNEDYLDNLNTFIRSVKNGKISLRDGYATLNVNNSNLQVAKDGISVQTEKDIQLSSGKNFNFSSLTLNAEKEVVALSCGDLSHIMMGKDNISIQTSNTKQLGSDFRLSNSGVKLSTDGDIKIGPSKDKYIGYNAKENRFDIYNSASRISVGNHDIAIYSGPASIIMDWGNDYFSISYNSDKSFIKFHGDSININTMGDINISSTNGNVNIKGKKVSLNE